MSKELTEAKKRAIKKYDAENTRQIHLKLNLKTDADILEHLDHQENVQGYMKRLIREDMNEHDSRERFIRRAEEAEKKIIDLKFPAIDGFQDDEAINICVENDHTIYVRRFGNWEVRFDADAKKVLTVRNLSNFTIEP